MGKRKSKSVVNEGAIAPEVLEMNHAGMSALDDLDAMLAEVEMPIEVSDEVDELPVELSSDEAVEELVSDAAIVLDEEGAIEDAVAALDREAVYAEVPADPIVDLVLPVEAEVEAPVAVKAKATRKPRAAKAEGAPKKERIYFGSDKVKRLRYTLGDKLGDFMVLTLEDAGLDGDDLKAKQDETIAVIDAMGVKVKNRATLLLEFASGKSAKLNNVIFMALQILAKEGALVTGDKGNYFQALLAHPYSPAAARAMGNNTINCLRQLKLIVPSDDKQVYVANPQSLLLAFISPKLGLEFGGMDEGDFEDELIEVAGVSSEVTASPAEVAAEPEVESVVSSITEAELALEGL